MVSGAADDAAVLLLLLASGDEDDVEQQRLGRIPLQQTLVHLLHRLKSRTHSELLQAPGPAGPTEEGDLRQSY